ncbi:alpha/beta fold hydrolase [Acinetobacter sp.]|uniref:alpha/beta fold hydrolase n=1 Tax=Acinetobacter sp. TaxID=472 RepID=UPI002FCA09F8
MPDYRMPDGEQLYVREYGQGQPVLVLSGLGMQSWQWHLFLYRFRRDFKFIIPDWRGFGASSQCRIPELDAISSHWRDIDCLLGQLAHDQFSLIAYSMGATAAMHGMQYGNFSAKIHSYLHIDQSPKIAADASWPFGLLGSQHAEFMQQLQRISALLARHPQQTQLQQLSLQERHQLLEAWLAFIQLQAGSQSITPFLFQQALKHPHLHRHLLPMQRLDYFLSYVNSYLHHREDYRQAIRRLDCPATFFIGEQSRLYPAEGQKIIASSLPQSTAVLFKKSGHAPLLSEPLKFGREIGHFLQRSAKTA